jgi:hypothetical protein
MLTEIGFRNTHPNESYPPSYYSYQEGEEKYWMPKDRPYAVVIGKVGVSTVCGSRAVPSWQIDMRAPGEQF